MVRRALSIAVLLAALASSSPATAYDKYAFVAPPDQALLVFIQNTREDRDQVYTVFQADYQCIAEVGGGEAEVIPMKPGKHRMYVSGYDNHRIEMDLAPGRTYFVRLYSTAKVTLRASDVALVQRGVESFKHVKAWLRGARVKHASDDPCRGKPLKERKNRTNRRINDANAAWKAGDELYHYKYTLLKEDGLTPDEVSWL